MALVSAIKFRDLADQLTALETSQFINDLNSSHPEIIIQLLSTRFIDQSSSASNDSLNSYCNERISAIIQSRDSDSNGSDAATLAALPQRLIGVCSSFLDQKSHRRLSLCSRATYLGTSTPITLRELNLMTIPTAFAHSHLDLSFFPMATKLHLGPSFNLDSVHTMRRLEKLDLRFAELRSAVVLAKYQPINERLKYLVIDQKAYWPTISEFLPSITSFKNLQFLDLQVANGAEALESEMKAISKTLNCVKGLCLRGGGQSCQIPFMKQLLMAIGHQLEYFKLDNIHDFDLKNKDFGNLRQFQMTDVDAGSLSLTENVLKTTKNLEKVKFSVGFEFDSRPWKTIVDSGVEIVPQWMQCMECRKWRILQVPTAMIRKWRGPIKWTCAQNVPPFDRCSQTQQTPDQDEYTRLQLSALTIQRKLKIQRQQRAKRNVRMMLIPETLAKCENLEYLEIECDHITIIGQILDEIKRGLFQSRKYEKRMMKIKIVAPADAIRSAPSGLIVKIGQIINQLRISPTEQWMILWEGTDKDTTNMMQKLSDSLTDDVRIFEDNKSDLTAITNYNCNIDGYDAMWKMEF